MKHICTKFVAMLLVIAMIAGVLPFAFAANVGPFTDVKDTDWFASNVQYVYDNGLMNGTTTTTFEPESNLTRAQTAMVLWRIAGQPAPTAKAPFTDLVDAWYRDAIAWAAEQKVVNGRGDGTFDPAGFITREELVTMIWRYAGEAASEQDLSNWPDADKVYDYAAGAMKWAVETGVINGKDGKLAPKDNATRAQFAAIIERYMKLNDTKADDIVILYTNDVHANITGGSSKAPTLTYEQVAAVPRDLDGVADGALDARGRRGERLGHLRIEHLCDGVDDIHVVHGNQDRLPEILIALDVRGDADLVNDRGDHGLDVGVALCCDGGFARNGALADLVETLHDGTAAAWFQHDILHAERHKH